MAWVGVIVAVAPWLFAATFLGQAWTFLHSSQGAGVAGVLGRVVRFVANNYESLLGITFAAVVAPLLGIYAMLRAMVDIGDWLDLKTQQWRAERFKKYGW